MGYWVGPGRWGYDETLIPVNEWLALSDAARNAQRRAAIKRGIDDAAKAGVTVAAWHHIRIENELTAASPMQPRRVVMHCEANVPNQPAASP